MTWLEEAMRGLTGAMRLVLHDRDGYQLFDLSRSGFWRSFAAIVMTAPLYLFGNSIALENMAEAGGAGDPVSSSGTADFARLVLLWVLWPFAIYYVARWARLGAGYVRYVVAYNWSSVLTIAAQVLPMALYHLGIIGGDMAMVLLLVAILWAFYFSWYIARTALGVSSAFAVAMVLGELVLGVATGRLMA